MDNLAATSATGSSGQSSYVPSNAMQQQDFIQLMMAQMRNQDPTKPLDPNQFMSQLAQFSTVNGIQALQESFNALAANLSTDQTMRAAALVGHSVMVPGEEGMLAEGDVLVGQALLPASATDTVLKVYDSTGALVRTIPLGPHPAGAMDFAWDGFKDNGSPAAFGKYKVVAEATIEGKVQALETGIKTRVDSVALNPYGGGAMLNLANGMAVPMSAIYQIM